MRHIRVINEVNGPMRLTQRELSYIELIAEGVVKQGNQASTSDNVTRKIVTLLQEEEGFSGKRPFGNSSWTADLELPLVKAGLVTGTIDADGWLDTCDSAAARKLLIDAARSL